MVTTTVDSIKKIIFLVFWPITKLDAERWGFEYLSSKGFEVEVYDLSSFLKRKALQINPVKSAITADYIYKMSSYQEFDRKVMSVASCSVFIDQIMGLSEPDLKTERIFRILQKYKSRYFVMAAGVLPIANLSAKLWENVLSKFRNAMNPKILFKFIVHNCIVFVKKHTNIYALPYRIFGGNSEVVARYLQKYNLNPALLIPVHSLDYDTYLRYIRGADYKKEKQEATCVFLDEASTHHSDFALLGLKPLTGESYFPSMNRLFDAIENRTGLKVVIAAHPRSRYEDMPGVFGNREIIKGKTVELVAKSSMVLTHGSTAVSFAVLFSKPIMMIKTQEMIENNNLSNFLDAMNDSLGLKAVNIDNPDAVNKISFAFDEWPMDKYDDYKFKYIKSKNLEDLTVWEVVTKEINKVNNNLNTDLIV